MEAFCLEASHALAKDLHRLVYRSASCISHDDVVGLDAIFRASVPNNRRDGITGALALPDGKFVQAIERSAARLADLMSRLRADPRHENMITLGEWPISARLFAGWAMARPDPRPLDQQEFRIVTQDGSGAQVTGVLISMMAEPDRLFPWK